MATDAEVAELRDWLEQLFRQVRQLRIDQHIWEEVQGIIRDNAQIHQPSHFYAWMQDMYVSGIAMAIRRQLDDDTRTMSFYRFLKRIKGDPGAVSRKRYRALYTETDAVVQQLKSFGLLEKTINSTYDSFVGEGKPQPAADDIEAQIQELQKVASRFVSFANKVVAHDDQAKPTTLPTFDEVDVVVKYLEKLIQHYVQLMNAAHRAMDLNFQYDWKAIFRVPWIP